MANNLPRDIVLTATFKKAVKDRTKVFHPRFIEAIYHLMNDLPLAESFVDHPLANVQAGIRECHIKPDLLLVYQKQDNDLILLFLTNHNDLSKQLNK